MTTFDYRDKIVTSKIKAMKSAQAEARRINSILAGRPFDGRNSLVLDCLDRLRDDIEQIVACHKALEKIESVSEYIR